LDREVLRTVPYLDSTSSRLVRDHLLDHHEHRRRAGLQHLADPVPEGLIDTNVPDTPHDRPIPAPMAMPKNGMKKEPEEETPEQPPGGALAHRVMIRGGLDAPLLVADDHGDRGHADRGLAGR
jgi:hypothetical protein